MRNVNFVCPDCGCKTLMHVEIGIILKSPVTGIEVYAGEVDVDYADEGTIILTSIDEAPVRTLGYECGDCGARLVRPPKGEECISSRDLYRWLRGERMIGDEQEDEEQEEITDSPLARTFP